MGNSKSKKAVKAVKTVVEKSGFAAIGDKYETYEALQQGLRKHGLESSNLIVFFDYTKSNEWQGEKSFGGRCLHELKSGGNPYQRVTRIIGKTLEVFDDDKLIPAFGFGDTISKGTGVFPFKSSGKACHGFEEVLERYNVVTKNVQLCGPTSFAPAIYKAIDVVRETKSYHIAIIIADGVIDDEAMKQQTIDSIVEASKYPLSIIMIGVGDGPWDLMKKFDDELPERKFDNFQFVQFDKMGVVSKQVEVDFAHMALMEIPDQYKLIKQLGLYKNVDSDWKSKSQTVTINFPEEVSQVKNCSIETGPPTYDQAIEYGHVSPGN